MAQPAHISGNTEALQRQLNADEVLLEYIVTDTSVLINAIGRDSVCSSTQSLNQLFWFSLRSFRKKLKSAEPLNFLVPGEILYMVLIKPLQQFISGRRRLIIIPGDVLSGLPFEAFIRSDSLSLFKDLCTQHYLIQDHEVIYHHSKNFRNERNRERGVEDNVPADEFKISFMGFSPVYKRSKTCPALPSTRNEIFEIGTLFRQKGKSSWLVYDELSGKEHFKNLVCRGQIIHLATHYIQDMNGPGSGGFLFSSGNFSKGRKGPQQDCLLTCDEIACLQLSADLIVLNSCSFFNTVNVGNSPAQLFYQAGARNILSTLWNVTDVLAGQFMIDFYRTWLSGKSYSQALREVKLQWISCTATTMPSIWAPYVLMGE
jgi:CHAT domain-containing protein